MQKTQLLSIVPVFCISVFVVFLQCLYILGECSFMRSIHSSFLHIFFIFGSHPFNFDPTHPICVSSLATLLSGKTGRAHRPTPGYILNSAHYLGLFTLWNMLSLSIACVLKQLSGSMDSLLLFLIHPSAHQILITGMRGIGRFINTILTLVL